MIEADGYAVQIDKTRMEKALSSPRFEIPPNLTRDQIIDFILSKATAEPEKEYLGTGMYWEDK